MVAKRSVRGRRRNGADIVVVVVRKRERKRKRKEGNVICTG
jgi:hypothetical protein